MSGAGSATVAFVEGTGFDTIAGTPTYYSPGHNIRITELSLDNVLERLRTPDNEEAVDSIAGQFQGAFSCEYTMSATTEGNVRNIVFNDGSGTGFDHTNIAPTSRWFIGADYFDTSFSQNTVELELRSVIPLNFTLRYDVNTNTIRNTLTMAFADVNKNTSVTPGSITGPAVGADAPFHGTALTVDGNAVNRDQSVVLSFDGPLYRYHFQSARNPVNATLANPTTSLTSSVIYHKDDFVGYALGGASTDTTVQDDLDNVNGSLVFSQRDGTTIVTYTFTRLKMNQWNAQDWVNADADLVGESNWHVNGGISIS